MKILLVSLYLVEYAVELANGLGRRHQVHLVLSRHRVNATIGEALNKRIPSTVSYTLLPEISLRSPSIFKRIFSVVRILTGIKHDIIHLQESANPLNPVFLVFSSRPVVTTVHDVVIHPGKEASSKASWKCWVSAKIRRHGYGKIIVHGENLKKQVVNSYKKPARDVFVVPHGCLFSFDSNKQSEAIEEPHTLLFFGRIQTYKGLRYLIDAEPLVRKVFPDLKIMVAGEGEDLEIHKCRLLSNPHFEVHDRFIPNEEVPFFFRRASAVVLPYVEASQSGIASMAFAFGKPVIATNVGSLPEMVINGETGFIVPPRDTRRLADAIIVLLQDGERRKRMGREAFRLAKTSLGWNHVARLTERAYQEALKAKYKRCRVYALS